MDGDSRAGKRIEVGREEGVVREEEGERKGGRGGEKVEEAYGRVGRRGGRGNGRKVAGACEMEERE